MGPITNILQFAAVGSLGKWAGGALLSLGAGIIRHLAAGRALIHCSVGGVGAGRDGEAGAKGYTARTRGCAGRAGLGGENGNTSVKSSRHLHASRRPRDQRVVAQGAAPAHISASVAPLAAAGSVQVPCTNDSSQFSSICRARNGYASPISLTITLLYPGRARIIRRVDVIIGRSSSQNHAICGGGDGRPWPRLITHPLRPRHP